MNNDNIVDFDADTIDLDDEAALLIAENYISIDARRKIERILEAKALKELDEDIEWWGPE